MAAASSWRAAPELVSSLDLGRHQVAHHGGSRYYFANSRKMAPIRKLADLRVPREGAHSSRDFVHLADLSDALAGTAAAVKDYANP